MYVVLSQEIAEVDQHEFEKVGVFQSDVTVAPCYDSVIAVKGSASSPLADMTERQQSFYLCLDTEKLDYHDLSSVPKACALYRYRGKDRPNYVGQDFVEFRYEYELGALSIMAYFLVLAQDCEFGIIRDGMILSCEFPWLWREGFIKGT